MRWHPRGYGGERRRLRVIKMRGIQIRGGYHDFVIRKGGVSVFPRLVASDHDVADRAAPAIGGSSLDALVGGGLARGTSTLLVGPSGVGKSTLVNALVGVDVQETGAVREGDQRGRHTTTARELILLPDGGTLLDTPGLRAVSLWDADDGLSLAFADIEELAARCKFRDCSHRTEPGCAVRAAISGQRATRPA